MQLALVWFLNNCGLRNKGIPSTLRSGMLLSGCGGMLPSVVYSCCCDVLCLNL
jgi:hypothetical protein